VTDFLTVEDVLFLHANQVDLYGGEQGLRDTELLDSAVAQPQTTFGGKHLHVFPFGMAAAYMFHLVQNHPFLDGNKRTGVVAALTFLDLNGIDVDAPTGELYDITLSIATGNEAKDGIAEFLRSHVS